MNTVVEKDVHFMAARRLEKSHYETKMTLCAISRSNISLECFRHPPKKTSKPKKFNL